LSSIEDMP
ncbi:unnamed protein product, partial [Allacma fusca]